MIPKISINYSYIYDNAVHTLAGMKFNESCIEGGELFAKRLKEDSARDLPRAMKAYEEVSGLRWQKPSTEVFVVHHIPYDFAWPVTIKVRENMWDAVETLMHEMGHQIIFQNEDGIRRENMFTKKYRKEPRDVHDHILTHAILWKAYRKMFGDKELRRIITGYEKWKNHYRAWQIVKKEGADRIIRAYVK